MPKFFIDESLSPLLTDTFREVGYEAVVSRDVGLKGKNDEEVIVWIKKHRYVVVTKDKDFGEIYYHREQGKIGVVLLRSPLQGLPTYIRLVKYAHTEGRLRKESLNNLLIVVSEGKIRQFPSEDN